MGIILLVYNFLTSHTVIGRHLYALGGNEKAARLSGVRTNLLLFLAYVNMAFLAAVAGIVFAARLNSASPRSGQSFELDAIGALIMGVLNNGMSIMGISSNAQQVVKGLVLLAAVVFDVLSKREISFAFLSHFRGKLMKDRRGATVDH